MLWMSSVLVEVDKVERLVWTHVYTPLCMTPIALVPTPTVPKSTGSLCILVSRNEYVSVINAV